MFLKTFLSTSLTNESERAGIENVTIAGGGTNVGVFLAFNTVVVLNSVTIVIGVVGSATSHEEIGVSVVTEGATTTVLEMSEAIPMKVSGEAKVKEDPCKALKLTVGALTACENACTSFNKSVAAKEQIGSMGLLRIVFNFNSIQPTYQQQQNQSNNLWRLK